MKYILLDNRSDYEVTVELYTGDQHEDGSMVFEDYNVSANSTKRVESEVTVVYVDGYSPANLVNMDIQGSKVVFTNQ